MIMSKIYNLAAKTTAGKGASSGNSGSAMGSSGDPRVITPSSIPIFILPPMLEKQASITSGGAGNINANKTAVKNSSQFGCRRGLSDESEFYGSIDDDSNEHNNHINTPGGLIKKEESTTLYIKSSSQNNSVKLPYQKVNGGKRHSTVTLNAIKRDSINNCDNHQLDISYSKNPKYFSQKLTANPICVGNSNEQLNNKKASVASLENFKYSQNTPNMCSKSPTSSAKKLFKNTVLNTMETLNTNNCNDKQTKENYCNLWVLHASNGNDINEKNNTVTNEEIIYSKTKQPKSVQGNQNSNLIKNASFDNDHLIDEKKAEEKLQREYLVNLLLQLSNNENQEVNEDTPSKNNNFLEDPSIKKSKRSKSETFLTLNALLLDQQQTQQQTNRSRSPNQINSNHSSKKSANYLNVNGPNDNNERRFSIRNLFANNKSRRSKLSNDSLDNKTNDLQVVNKARAKSFVDLNNLNLLSIAPITNMTKNSINSSSRAKSFMSNLGDEEDDIDKFFNEYLKKSNNTPINKNTSDNSISNNLNNLINANNKMTGNTNSSKKSNKKLRNIFTYLFKRRSKNKSTNNKNKINESSMDILKEFNDQNNLNNDENNQLNNVEEIMEEHLLNELKNSSFKYNFDMIKFNDELNMLSISKELMKRKKSFKENEQFYLDASRLLVKQNTELSTSESSNHIGRFSDTKHSTKTYKSVLSTNTRDSKKSHHSYESKHGKKSNNNHILSASIDVSFEKLQQVINGHLISINIKNLKIEPLMEINYIKARLTYVTIDTIDIQDNSYLLASNTIHHNHKYLSNNSSQPNEKNQLIKVIRNKTKKCKFDNNLKNLSKPLDFLLNEEHFIAVTEEATNIKLKSIFRCQDIETDGSSNGTKVNEKSFVFLFTIELHSYIPISRKTLTSTFSKKKRIFRGQCQIYENFIKSTQFNKKFLLHEI